jgi:putative ABC transport system substrate-binding protein
MPRKPKWPLNRWAGICGATSDDQIEVAFAMITGSGIRALLISNNAFFSSRSQQLGALTSRHAVPALYVEPEFAEAGGLMSYGDSLAEAYHLVGVYTGRILKGEKPDDLPVQQQTKIELVLNLKTAKALGLNIPLPLLGRADEVIE